MIISASRRTDLPAFFPKETIEKIVGMNNDEQKTLFKKNIVDAVIFWTKNAKPILPYLNELDELEIPYYFQYTMNDYPGLEPNIPDYWDRVNTFINLSEMIGKHRVIWRYDPFLKSVLPVEYTILDDLKRFEFMGHCLYKYTEKIVFSFLDPYDKIPSGIEVPTKEEEFIIANKIIDINKLWKLQIATCAESIDIAPIKRNRCIDPELLSRLGVEIHNPLQKDYSQRKICDCYPSKDIGTYHTCKHNCVYCVPGNTLILMSDGSVKPMEKIIVGDEIFGTIKTKCGRKLIKTVVLNKYISNKQKFIIHLKNNKFLECSSDHRWLSNRGWKYTTPGSCKKEKRPYLTDKNELLYLCNMNLTPIETPNYKLGYISGIVKGDGLLKIFADKRKKNFRPNGKQYQFRLALKDLVATDRTDNFLKYFNIICNHFQFEISKGLKVDAIRVNSKSDFEKISDIIEFRNDPEFFRGFLAGIFDSEGSGNNYISTIRIHNSDKDILDFIENCLSFYKFKYIYDVDHKTTNKVVRTIRITGGLPEIIRFRQIVNPSILRKINIDGRMFKNMGIKSKIVSVKSKDEICTMYDITTGTGDFIANGFISHNCYAR